MPADLESPEDFVAALKTEAERQIADDGDAGDEQAIAFLVAAIRARDASVRAEARAEMLALLHRQCRNGVTASVSEEWLRCNEVALISGTLDDEGSKR